MLFLSIVDLLCLNSSCPLQDFFTCVNGASHKSTGFSSASDPREQAIPPAHLSRSYGENQRTEHL